MKIIESLEIERYRNIRHTKLDGLKDLNILIGPNNCGKTNILYAIKDTITGLAWGRDFLLCDECKKVSQSNEKIIGAYCIFPVSGSYLKKGGTKLIFSFNNEEIDKIVPGVLEKQKNLLSGIAHSIEKLILKLKASTLVSEHVCMFAHQDILRELKESIMFCPDARLLRYKDKEFGEYLGEKLSRGTQWRKLIHFLHMVDPNISDYQYRDLVRTLEGEEILALIKEQGSGVRSLICLATDILFSDAKIILIDEPELGLNPRSKQALLKFLFEESRSKQIFVATHDPTFVNPSLWKTHNVSVFFYSPVKEEFVKINLEEDIKDPETFAGYLPHTISLKPAHIYVEGASDVYIFQIWLRRYLQENYENWAEILNEVGIYHLGGSFWSHLLYTIPEKPYRCIVILDGDKKGEIEKICEKYDKVTINTSKFEFCKDTDEIHKIFESQNRHPIYCLNEQCIEKYLGHECKEISFDKKIDGPIAAEKMEDIPPEVPRIFKSLLGEPPKISQKTKTIRVTLISKKAKAVELKEGEEIPAEAAIEPKHYKIEMPESDYRKLETEAKKENISVEEKIRSKYKYADQLPRTWKIT